MNEAGKQSNVLKNASLKEFPVSRGFEKVVGLKINKEEEFIFNGQTLYQCTNILSKTTY